MALQPPCGVQQLHTASGDGPGAARTAEKASAMGIDRQEPIRVDVVHGASVVYGGLQDYLKRTLYFASVIQRPGSSTRTDLSRSLRGSFVISGTGLPRSHR